MPNRIIKESINESRGLSECTYFVQDLYKRLITYADDYGRFNADPQIMRARLYPRDLELVTEEDILDGLIELAGVDKIRFYTAQPRREIYGAFPSWDEHQRLRESKTKIPAPDDVTINDWYLRRFVPLAMKAEIVARDGFKCTLCGKFLTACTDAKKFVKLGSGLYHIDHIVPCSQGGRATMENLRLTCPECNLKRKRHFTIEEILKFTQLESVCGNSPQVAASCGELRPESESEENKNPNQKEKRKGKRTQAEPAAAPSASPPPSQRKPFVPPTAEDVTGYCQESGIAIDAQGFVDHYTSNGWMVGKKRMTDWRAAVRNWERRDREWGVRNGGKKREIAPSVSSSFDAQALQDNILANFMAQFDDPEGDET